MNITKLKNKLTSILSKHDFKNKIYFAPHIYISRFEDNKVFLEINEVTEVGIDLNKARYTFILLALDTVENI